MANAIKYTIFKTKWGYFGLAGTENALLRTHLPLPDRKMAKTHLLTGLQTPRYNKDLFRKVQEQVTTYFEGGYVNFNKDAPILLDGFSLFARSVLTACRDITFGQPISYGRLAQRIGNPSAARAVGRVMAQNPLPLIIPCHRVVRSPCLRRGKLVPAQAWIGGFSAAGGVKLKKRMLKLERQARTD